MEFGDAKTILREYLERYYSRERRNSTNRYLNPVEKPRKNSGGSLIITRAEGEECDAEAL